jgi:hypothetical protein
MNIRDAILEAAAHIERNPDDFNFHSIEKPSHCGTPGCAIGWIGVFAGIEEEHPSWLSAIKRQTGIDAHDFYKKMSDIQLGWIFEAASCAITMRLYADKYHPAERRDLIPESVRNIFTMTPEQLGREFAEL